MSAYHRNTDLDLRNVARQKLSVDRLRPSYLGLSAYCYGKSSVCRSVGPSITLRYRNPNTTEGTPQNFDASHPPLVDLSVADIRWQIAVDRVVRDNAVITMESL